MPNTLSFDHARYEVCRKCEHLTGLKICEKCSCFVPLKVKWPTASCPLNKWAVIDQKSKR